MEFVSLVQLLKQKCNEPLPGFDAHLRMAPYRKIPSVEVLEQQRLAYRQAAVSILLFPVEVSICFALIQRPNYEGVHGGQISFPGGKLEPHETFEQAALREMKEEIGVDLHDVEVIGELSEVFIPPSKMRVVPYVCYLPYTPVFKADPNEVDEIITVKISDILQRDAIKTTKLIVGKNTANALEMEVPYFDLNNKVVWGATAVILSELKALLEND
jgi:8-oxo-dGTP pyrophosphatase MutT (NUDIX family)